MTALDVSGPDYRVELQQIADYVIDMPGAVFLDGGNCRQVLTCTALQHVDHWYSVLVFDYSNHSVMPLLLAGYRKVTLLPLDAMDMG